MKADDMQRLLVTAFSALKPRNVMRALLRCVPSLSTAQKVEWDVHSRPEYAFGLYRAAAEAKALGLARISAIEFGVAGGKGLIAMEELAEEISRSTGVGIDVYGFDTGEGMPEPVDFRDLPHVWQKGFYKMNADELQKRLHAARLVIGDVRTTVDELFRNPDLDAAPVGFIAFDLDYYSSTVAAINLLRAGNTAFLPRVFCYFDDVIGGEWDNHSEYAGVLLAIKEFNETSASGKICPIHRLDLKRRFSAVWNAKMYINHRFDHPLYTKYLTPEWHKELPLS
jgi:hypothetical protein